MTCWNNFDMEVLRVHWPAGTPVEEIRGMLQSKRDVASIGNKARKLGMTRPDWFLQQSRQLGGQQSAEKQEGRILWSEAMTRRLVALADQYGPCEAARRMGVNPNKACGRLHRIGWKENKPKRPSLMKIEAPEQFVPTVYGADRMGALMANAARMGISI